jgi:hypothetical protein
VSFDVPATLKIGVPYDIRADGYYNFCFIRHGARACIRPQEDGWVILDVRRGDGSGGKQYLTLRKDGHVYARAIVRLT